jgi:TatD DNase family protein
MTYPDLIDIGVNLTNSAFKADLDQVLARAKTSGVAALLITGTDEAVSQAALDLARSRPGQLWPTAGVHPHHAKDVSPGFVDTLGRLARQPEVVAIGETGLDFNRDFSPRPLQEQVFEDQLALACELNKPVFLHQRDAHHRFMPLIKAFRDRLPAGVVHCFTGSREELRDYLDLDLHIGVTGWIADERRGGLLRELVREIPADRLMVETDAPYLVPRDLRPKPKSGRNEPAFLPHIIDWVARCSGRPAALVAEQTSATARRFFGLPEPS